MVEVLRKMIEDNLLQGCIFSCHYGVLYFTISYPFLAFSLESIQCINLYYSDFSIVQILNPIAKVHIVITLWTSLQLQ